MKRSSFTRPIFVAALALLLLTPFIFTDVWPAGAQSIQVVNPETGFVRLYLGRSGNSLILTPTKPSTNPQDEISVTGTQTWHSGDIITGDIPGNSFYYFIRSATPSGASGESVLRATIRVNGAEMGSFDLTAQGPLFQGDSGTMVGADPDLFGSGSVSLELTRISGPQAQIIHNGQSYIDLPRYLAKNFHARSFVGFLNTNKTGIKTHLPATRRGAILPVYMTLGASNSAVAGSFVVPETGGNTPIRAYGLNNAAVSEAYLKESPFYQVSLTFPLVDQQNLGLKGPITGALDNTQYPSEMKLSIGAGAKKKELGTVYIPKNAYCGHFSGKLSHSNGGSPAATTDAVFTALYRTPTLSFTLFAPDPDVPQQTIITDGSLSFASTRATYQGDTSAGEPDMYIAWNTDGYDLTLTLADGRVLTGHLGRFGEHPESGLKVRSIKPKALKRGATTMLTVKHKGAVPGTLVSLTRLSNFGIARLTRYDWFPDHFDVYVHVPAGSPGQFRLRLTKPSGTFKDAKGVLSVR